MWGQSDPKLKKYLWVVIRTQKERKLQTLIEVCTDFSSLVSPTHLHRPAEQTFAVHQESDSYTEGTDDQEEMFVVGDRPAWNRQAGDTHTAPSLQHGLRNAPNRWPTGCPASASGESATSEPTAQFSTNGTYRSGSFANKVLQLWRIWTHAEPLPEAGR